MYILLFRGFDFARYLTFSKENHIVNMLKVSPAQWCVFVLVIGINFARVVGESSNSPGAHLQIFQCETAHGSSSSLSEEDKKHLRVIILTIIY